MLLGNFESITMVSNRLCVVFFHGNRSGSYPDVGIHGGSVAFGQVLTCSQVHSMGCFTGKLDASLATCPSYPMVGLSEPE